MKMTKEKTYTEDEAKEILFDKKRSYYRDYYKRNKEKYKEYVRRYRMTEKGKATAIKVKENLLMKNPTYYKDYLINRRKKAKAEGICTRCYKEIAGEGRALCRKCLDFHKEFYEKKNGNTDKKEM